MVYFARFITARWRLTFRSLRATRRACALVQPGPRPGGVLSAVRSGALWYRLTLGSALMTLAPAMPPTLPSTAAIRASDLRFFICSSVVEVEGEVLAALWLGTKVFLWLSGTASALPRKSSRCRSVKEIRRPFDNHAHIVLHHLGQVRYLGGIRVQGHATGQGDNAAVAWFQGELPDIATSV